MATIRGHCIANGAVSAESLSSTTARVLRSLRCEHAPRGPSRYENRRFGTARVNPPISFAPQTKIPRRPAQNLSKLAFVPHLCPLSAQLACGNPSPLGEHLGNGRVASVGSGSMSVFRSERRGDAEAAAVVTEV